MATKLPPPHLIETVDPHRDNPHNPRVCDRCGLPETRVDVHALPAQDPEVRALQDRILGEHPTESENAE